MKVKVTRKHIKYGVRGSSTSCPIALALLSAGHEVGYVDGGMCKVDGFRYNLRRGRRFIHRFDEGLPVKPVTAELTLCTYP